MASSEVREAAAEIKKHRQRAIAVSKLIGGKLVTELADSEKQRLLKSHLLCLELAKVPDWKDAAVAAETALATLLAKCDGQ